MMNDARRHRALGALAGLAVGDALGTTLEFGRRDAQPHHTEMTGGGPFGLKPGEWTDDTAMALALGTSLVERGGLDPRDLMDRFVGWWRRGDFSCTGDCFDIGITTRTALRDYLDRGDPFAGSTSEDSAGNGSIMRLAPAVLFALGTGREPERLAAEQGRTTHGAPQAVEACALMAGLLRAAILDGDRRALDTSAWTGHACWQPFAREAWRTKARHEISSSGYVVATLEAALWSVGSTDSFEDAVVLAANLADDADTVGAVTGQLAGALYGLDAIPARWLEPLAWRKRILDLGERLLAPAPAQPVP
jgi:ADP-ribosyl-[dinitrogen reductase] hydrolase